MDQATERRLDAIVEDEIRRGYRIKALPDDLQTLLKEEGGPDIRRVRFTRLNPGKRRKIAEVVQRQYHRDLKNADILSREQVMKLVVERGEWSSELDTEMKSLQESTNRDMGVLFMDGARDATWAGDLMRKSQAFRAWVRETFLPDKAIAVLQLFDRWVDFTPDLQDEYTKKYAAEQERDRYIHELDMQNIQLQLDHVETYDKLVEIDELRDKVVRVIKLQRERMRLLELQVKHTKIFADCVEQRRDNAEEMSRVYFTTDRLDEAGAVAGPLTPTFDQMWDLPEDVVQWLLLETYFFQNGIPDEAREYLETFGFLKAERDAETTSSPSGASEASEESPVPPSSNSATAVVVEMGAASSA